MPGIPMRPGPAHPPPGMFDQLTTLELSALSARLQRARRRTRALAVRARSLPEAWDMIRLGNQLADLEDEVNRTLRCH